MQVVVFHLGITANVAVKIVCRNNGGESGTKGVPGKTAYARYDIKKYRSL